MTHFRLFGDVPLSRASLPSKVIVTLFLVSLLMAYGVGVLNIWDKTGLTYKSKVWRYRGAEETEEATELFFPRSLAELIELTHEHTFDMAMLLLIVGHLFQLTSLTERLKMTVWIAAFVSMFLFIWSPWLIKYVAAPFAIFLIAGEMLMTISFLTLTIVPLYEMWFLTLPPQRRRGRHET